MILARSYLSLMIWFLLANGIPWESTVDNPHNYRALCHRLGMRGWDVGFGVGPGLWHHAEIKSHAGCIVPLSGSPAS